LFFPNGKDNQQKKLKIEKMKNTDIQWAHSTINPVMGCDGCELWPGKGKVVNDMVAAIKKLVGTVSSAPTTDMIREIVLRVIGNRQNSVIYAQRNDIADTLANRFQLDKPAWIVLVDVIRSNMKCYAGLLGTMRADHKGYARQFEEPKLFAGRMAEAAKWDPPTAAERMAKPWLLTAPRMIFVSDMGDALSKDIKFAFLKQEIIDVVATPNGQQHLWLWLTKRPGRMADFGNWLQEQGVSWPDNLVAMTTVTSQKTASRLNQLRQVPSRLKGLSCEPLFGKLRLDLTGIDWVITGGGSDTLAEPFRVEWALDLHAQCQASGTAFFLKQLGKNPVFNGRSLTLSHRHGGDWNEWPVPDWRTRDIPDAFLYSGYCEALTNRKPRLSVS
jgi:protein gp37